MDDNPRADMRRVADDKLRHLFAACRKFVYLCKKLFGIHYDPVAYYADLVLIKYSGRKKMEDKLFIAHNDGMSGVCPALIAYHGVRIGCKRVNAAAFSLITPLYSYYGVYTHNHHSLYIWQLSEAAFVQTVFYNHNFIFQLLFAAECKVIGFFV